MRVRAVTLSLVLLTGLAHAADEVTGVIVDATTLDIQRARFPRLYDPDGKMVYPTPKLCQSPDYTGFEGYKPGLQTAARDVARVGKKPLVIRPDKPFSDDPTEGSMTLTAADAKRLLELNGKTGLLDKDKIVIVIGLSILSRSPDKDAKDVAPDAAVVVVFSKALRPETVTADAVSVVDAKGGRIAGDLTHDPVAHRLTWRPRAPWTAGETYTVTIRHGLEAETRAPLESDDSFAFTVKTEGGDGSAADGADRAGDSARDDD